MTSRNHHFVPQCYLRRFSYIGDRKSKLYTIDLEQKKAFTTLTRNIGAQRDFNRVDIEGLEPNSLEDAYSKFEDLVAPSLVRIDEAKSLKNESDKIMLINLIALLAIRNPRWRSELTRFQTDVAKKIMDISLSKKNIWESQLKKMKRDGFVDANSNVSYEQVKEFHESEKYKIHIPRERNIQLELKGFNAVLDCLVTRNWCLVSSNHKTGFVTTDHPVCLAWSDMSKNVSQLHPPGFGHAGTDVIFPVSKNFLVIGRYENGANEFEANEIITAYFNTIIATYSSRQIYAADDMFLFLDKEGNLSQGSHFIK